MGGKNSFYQPTSPNNTDEYQLPYKLEFTETSATCMGAPDMSYKTDIAMWNGGKNDAWNTARDPGYGMSYFDRKDLPFYWALADEFTIGDQYFQSVFTETNPNRLHFFTGSNGLSIGKKPHLSNDQGTDLDWETVAETLDKANVTWRLYQESDNFDDNGLAWFAKFNNAKPGENLYQRGMYRSKDVVAEFEADIKAKKLPQVSWIVAPTALSEHASNHPQDGEDLSARLLKVLGDPSYRDVYEKTAFILNYDEGGQFFDHAWTPTPPVDDKDGKSTVTTEGEVKDGLPIGLGYRVPLMVISPWSKGGYVVSEVFDHTSTIKFIEKRFGVKCPNISPWRLAVVGDLTSAFNFSSFNSSWPQMPDTSNNRNASEWECENLDGPKVPKNQSMPSQIPGTRPARPLPYQFNVDVLAKADSLEITFVNTGLATGAFYVQNMLTLTDKPRKYTVEAGKNLSDTWAIGASYHVTVYGPNGFLRAFQSSAPGTEARASLEYVPSAGSVKLFTSSHDAVIQNKQQDQEVKRAGDVTEVDISAAGHWYHFVVTAGKASWTFMGHMETGKDSVSDPKMASGQAHFFAKPHLIHPETPAKLRNWERKKYSKDSCFNWEVQNGNCSLPQDVVNIYV